jgi:hypothetical protein
MRNPVLYFLQIVSPCLPIHDKGVEHKFSDVRAALVRGRSFRELVQHLPGRSSNLSGWNQWEAARKKGRFEQLRSSDPDSPVVISGALFSATLASDTTLHASSDLPARRNAWALRELLKQILRLVHHRCIGDFHTSGDLSKHWCFISVNCTTYLWYLARWLTIN